jgi:hypothetical protein
MHADAAQESCCLSIWLLVHIRSVLLLLLCHGVACTAAAAAAASAPTAAASCGGSPGPEWADSGCAFTRVGSQCIAPCPTGQQGVGYVAVCTTTGWQVTARDCANVTAPAPAAPQTCNFLPTASPPAGSKGWAAECAGRNDGETCRAACDGINSYFGKGYTALCQAGQWAVQPGGCQSKRKHVRGTVLTSASADRAFLTAT